MLVISRKPSSRQKGDCRLMIGGNIVITIVEVQYGKVKIGIEAPPDVAVMREEILSPEQVAAIERAARGKQ
jgi:carbon storage regulator